MRNNQFAIKPTAYDSQIQELTAVNFLDESNNVETDVIKLWLSFLKKGFLQADSESVFQQKLASLMATPDLDPQF